MKYKHLILILIFSFAIPLFAYQAAYAAPDYTGYYIKGHSGHSYYYNNLNGKTIIFNKYDSSAQLFKGEKNSHNFYELAYWNPDECFIHSKSSNPSVASVQDQCELYGSFDDDGGYYTSIIQANKKGTTTITVRETTPGDMDYDEFGNPVEGPSKVKTYKFKVIVTDKWYSGRLHKYTKIKHPKVYRTSKKVKITVKKVRKGDKIKIKIGKNKTVTKKVKKNKKIVSYKIKFKKQKAGRKVIVKVYDKYGKKVKSSSKPVYYASKIRRGMTKKQVEYIPGWGSPEHTQINGNVTTWWYNNYSKYVVFRYGRVRGWGK